MTVKRFVAPDMRRALDLVRQEMGPDAIILSTQRNKNGVEIITSTEMDYTTRGAQEKRQFQERFDEELDRPLDSDQAWQDFEAVEQAVRKLTPAGAAKPSGEELANKIEAARLRMEAARRAENKPVSSRVTAGSKEKKTGTAHSGFVAREGVGDVRVDETVSFDYSNEKRQRPAKGVDRQMAGLQEQVDRVSRTQRLRGDDEIQMNALRDEIADMRMLLEQQMWRMKETGGAAQSPLVDSLKDHLAALGLPAELVRKLAQTARPGQRLNGAWRTALACLTKQIQVDQRDTLNQGGVFAFVGPTGVGKTTTIAKLAARYVLEHGLGKVALITTDTFRVGAHDQLRSLGRILNVPVRVVDKERSLAAVVASLKDYPLVLIDTAGFRQGDPLLKEQEALLDACPGLKRILVLACNSQRQTLKASAHAFHSSKLLGCILTKIDESGCLGEALGVVAEQRIPVMYSADGQAIPSDITVASAAGLVAKAVSVMKQQRAAEQTFATAQ